MYRYFVGALALAPLSTIALAQDIAPPDAASSDADEQSTIIVTAARTQLPASALPLTVDIIDSEALERQVQISGSTVDAVSALLPSFSPTREKLTGAGESLRGRAPLYAINGIPQSTPVRDGSRDGYTIDPFFIDRVEVIYGSNALQGIGATGGVVNQVTVGAPREDGVSFRTLSQVTLATNFEGEGIGAKTGALVGYRAGPFDASIGATYEKRGAFFDGNDNRIGVDGTQGDIQDSDSWSVFARLGYELATGAKLEVVANRFELQGNANYVSVPGDRSAGIPASSIRGVTPGDPPSNKAELLSASLVDPDLAGGTFVLQGFYSRTNDVYGGGVFGTFQDPAIDPTGNLFDQSANRSRKLGGKVSYERAVPGFDDLVLTAGFDALFDRTEQVLVQTDRAWVPQTDFRSLAPFLQGNLALADGLVRLAGGLRFENVQLKVDDFTTLASYGPVSVTGGSPSFEDVLWNGGIIVEPIDGLRAYGSYAEGFTIADVGRILRGISQPNIDVDDYLSLEPVVSNNRELGLEWDRGALKASASYFWSSSEFGSILVLRNDVFEVERQPIEIEGFEASLSWQTPVPGLALSGGYANLTGQTDGDGDGLIDEDLDGANISPDRINLAADYSAGRFSARAQARMYLEREFNDASTATDFDGYTLVDAFISYRTDFGEISLAAQNLTNEFFITYDSDTVRVTDSRRFFSGRGRTFTLSLRSEF
ncbi:TonB-dependent receptor [Citromicrobium sp. RCC1885]|uniref:TonB-dependent receptor n=1 Tax=unclassified Citromicrobium TaxID=2630544 RepID=UPI0006C91C1D|nr:MULTISPECIES: TonB-dependent receptor [unclassified Citromicrobium]KPM21655.1 TonB-dependent receptor [Citromicrobium sp. RCC1885]KPM23419.1 TonB-dependent receptor [Citromicrobium sp. RCC1878]MAO05407.1 TonB-dependent receptor [Citromicrobium sp.]OAM07044.1 TonB-dependent receptor [Citromicrobium sp. RCC1897]|tara:strand:+ start:216 stop:2351 length:2136 start_codon:yes stop_codon:yes gene_type:complete